MSIYVEKNRRTKKLIQDSFMTILAEKAFDAITIGDITKQANINRGTFYLHYVDKYDLLDRIEAQLFEELGKHVDELQASYTAQNFTEEQANVAAMLFSFIEKHAPMLKVFLGNHGRNGFHIRFRDAFAEKVRANLENNTYFKEELSVPLDYFLAFITAAFLGLIEQWIQNGLDKTPEEMTSLYIDIIQTIRQN